MTGSIRTLIIVLTSSLFIATQSFAANLDSSDMDFAFGNSEQSTINPLGGELALLSPEEMLATEGDFDPFTIGFALTLVISSLQGYRGEELLNRAIAGGFGGVVASLASNFLIQLAGSTLTSTAIQAGNTNQTFSETFQYSMYNTTKKHNTKIFQPSQI